MVGQLALQAGDPGLGALHLLLDAGQLAGIGEQLPGLGVPVAGQLHQQRPLLQHGRGVTRGEHARDGGGPGVLERRRGGLRHAGLRRLELGVGVVQAHAHLGQPGLRRGQLLAGLVELLADLVELRRELVDPGLHLVNGRLRRRAGARGEDRKPAHGNQPGRDRDTAANPGLSSTKSHTHVSATLLVPLSAVRVPGDCRSPPPRRRLCSDPAGKLKSR